MFYPHLAEIKINRDEPRKDFNVELARKMISTRFERMAEMIIMKNLMKSAGTKPKKAFLDKVRARYEQEERYDSIKGFIDIWNHWRKFYFDRGPIAPKNKNQYTTIENIIKLCEEKEMNLNMFIACLHKSYQKRKLKPSYSYCLAYGEEAYDAFYDAVLADVDSQEYQDKALLR